MRLGYFTMPVHPLHRDYTQTLREDREAIILADQLGFHDAFVGEHLTDKAESVTNSMLFHATLIHSTKQIMLATGTTNLIQTHPVLIAVQAAMFDHLAEGRFIMGISPGALPSDAEVLRIDRAERNERFAETIQVILAIWEREPPYDIDFSPHRFPVSTASSFNADLGLGYLAKPYQKPRPEIVGTVVIPFSPGVVHMGKADFHPLSANFLLAHWLPTHWENYRKGCEEAGREAKVADWRVARTIFVADDDKVAQAYGKEDANSPYRFYYKQLGTKIITGGRGLCFKRYEGEPDEDVTLDRIVDDCVIAGSVNSVVDQILKMHDEIGPFGELVYAGMDWVDETLTKRSLQLMAEEVMPRVNAAIGADAPAMAK